MMKQLTKATLNQWQQTEQVFTLIDVRELSEREGFHIGGIHIPLDEIIRRKDEIPQDQPVVFYCKRGIRSQLAIQRLAARQYKGDFYNLANGILHLQA